MGLKIDRRDLLRLGLFTGAGLFSGASAKDRQNWGFEHFSDHAGQVNAGTSRKSAEVVQKPKTLAPYVDALPVPPVIRPEHSGNVVQIHMREFHQKVHRDLPPDAAMGIQRHLARSDAGSAHRAALFREMDQPTAEQAFLAHRSNHSWL